MQRPDQPTPAPPKTASCLHLVVGAGAEALAQCLSLADAADAVLFVDAGVLQLVRSAAGPVGNLVASVHFMAADLQAHGLFEAARRSQVDIVDEAGFCKLLAAHRHCLTWT
jgi:sulfur relay protein TusB/DsrH